MTELKPCPFCGGKQAAGFGYFACNGNMSPRTITHFDTRDDLIHAIEQAGRYIADHADNLLGEYPSLLSDITIKVNLYHDRPVTVSLGREHIVCDKGDYPS